MKEEEQRKKELRFSERGEKAEREGCKKEEVREETEEEMLQILAEKKHQEERAREERRCRRSLEGKWWFGSRQLHSERRSRKKEVKP